MAQITIADVHVPRLAEIAAECQMSVEKFINVLVAVTIEEFGDLDTPIAYEVVGGSHPEEGPTTLVEQIEAYEHYLRSLGVLPWEEV